MKNWQDTLISPQARIKEALQAIDKGALQIALVVDSEMHLLGTITDGDVRRGLLRNLSLDASVQEVMNKNPKVVHVNDSRELVKQLMHANSLHHIPVLDDERRIVTVEFLDRLIEVEEKENEVFLMAGGLGTRLRPLTENFPKPLLKVGRKPILETIIESFLEQGFKRFTISVNYKADLIEEYFGDGKKWGVQIKYVHETKRMGTAGALSLLLEKPVKPFFVMNADLLTKINFSQLLQFHVEQEATGTMCVRQYDYQVPYGVIQTDDHHLVRIEEKPVHQYFINAGIYVLNPEAINEIPEDTFFDMPSLFEKMVSEHKKAVVFPIREYWLDIGQMPDFDRANEEYEDIFG